MGNIVSNSCSKAVKAIARELDAGYRYQPGEMLRYMLSEIMALWGYSAWMPVPDDARAQVARAIGAYDDAIRNEEPFADILGPLYEELASHGSKQILGQFFTPWAVASMMARMTSPGDIKHADRSRLKVACDPACGSGVMMLATASTILSELGEKVLRGWSFHGCDLDPICARMMAVQFVANCASHCIEVGEVIVFCGDSIRVDRHKQLIVHASAPGVEVAPANAPFRNMLLANAAESAGLQTSDT
ncbi:N-6 DNA methylase [Burkholderia gladioli]|uniref:N-6 DNA methylase n=1 Tax=Burkholderia gladioli TaxID=28095 RepID=UPI001FC7E036|nr:N-6 DNA methylase [Burkholderia gladioli]